MYVVPLNVASTCALKVMLAPLAFVLAAIITPPDYVTQLLVAIPLASLYWVGVLLAYLIEKRRGGER